MNNYMNLRNKLRAEVAASSTSASASARKPLVSASVFAPRPMIASSSGIFATAAGQRMVPPSSSSTVVSGNSKTPSIESKRNLAAKNAANTSRIIVASASCSAPVSLSRKSSIPTGRIMPTSSKPSDSALSFSAPISRPPVARPTLMKTSPGADLKSRKFTDFNVRVPKIGKKEYSLMRFNGAHKVDFAQWNNVKMHREYNSTQHKTKLPIFVNKEVMPRHGAGSEYGREEREQARRQKYGIKKKYNKEDQPWVLKVGDQVNRKYKGQKEGGVSENASYFIFTQAKDGHFDAYPVKQWYNFTPVQKYKALSAEEAEEVYSRRNKVLNLFSVMVRKRMKVGEEEEGENKKDQVNRALKMSEMEDWGDEDEDGSAESGDENNKETNKIKNKKGAKKNTKKKKNDSDDDEPLEDSDDGDDDGRELDYISDSSDPSEDDEEKKIDLPGVSEEGQDETDTSSSENENDEKTEETEKVKGDGEKNKSKKKKKEAKEEIKSLDSEDEDAEDVIDKSDLFAFETESVVKEDSAPMKRKTRDILLAGPSKKSKVEVSTSLLTLAASEGITEEVVRKYLVRKPMTVAELLQKFKPKKTKIRNEDMVPIIAHILKKVNPTKRTQQNKIYFSLKN